MVVAGISRRAREGLLKDSRVLTSTVYSQSLVFYVQPHYQGFSSPHPRGSGEPMENSWRTILVPTADDFKTLGDSGDENAVGQNVLARG